jgi:hypothetical protein
MKNLLLLVFLCNILSFTKVSAFKNALKIDKHCEMFTGNKNCNTGDTCGLYASESGAIRTNALKSKPATKSNTIKDAQRQGTNNKRVNVQKNNGSGFCDQHT